MRRRKRLPVEAGVHVERDGLRVHLLERPAGARRPLHDERRRVRVAVPQSEHAPVARLRAEPRGRIGKKEVPRPDRDVDGQPSFGAVRQHSAQLVEVALVRLHSAIRVGEPCCVSHREVGVGGRPHDAQLLLGEAALEARRGIRRLERAGSRGEALGQRLPLGRPLRDGRVQLPRRGRRDDRLASVDRPRRACRALRRSPVEVVAGDAVRPLPTAARRRCSRRVRSLRRWPARALSCLPCPPPQER